MRHRRSAEADRPFCISAAAGAVSEGMKTLSRLLAFLAALAASAATAAEPALRQGKFHTPEQARAELEARWPDYDSAEKWAKRAGGIRQGILEGAGLSPLPPKGPLNPLRHSLRRQDGYTVENVALETAPGFFVCGNLYLPATPPEKLPLVLSTHGHWPPEPLQAGRCQEMMQLRCGALARMGCAVFAWDMVGHGESAAAGWNHTAGPEVLRLQLWNSIRALDFMLSLPGADPSRVAITGESGGGTQAFLLAAVDDRVTASIPCVQVSAWFYGGCVCESGLPIHVRPGHTANNAEIAATFAPKPQLVISDGQDWTRETPTLEFPFLQKIYGLSGHADRVENAHFAGEGHDFGPTKRRALDVFLAKTFRLDPAAADETKVTILPPPQLWAFDEAHPRPARALPPNAPVKLF